MATAVTLMFTDIQGSTRLLDLLGARYPDLLAEHHRVMREAIAAAGGREVDTAGDSFFAVFGQPRDATECAWRAQLALREADWPDGQRVRVRMGIHTGTPEVWDGTFVGMDVHRAARVMAVAHGGQVLLTDETRRALGSAVPVRDMGFHRLKDLPEPEHLFQLFAAGLDEAFGPLRSLNRSNLPSPANPIVGRERELADALRRLSRPEVRLLTLHGPGGAGKTRLAIEVAGEGVSRYRDGVWLVMLAPINDKELMLTELLRVLEIDPIPGQPLHHTLAQALAGRELLLVLDNFEHLIEAADVVAEIIARASNVDLLVTSREPLRLTGEHRLDVHPLGPADAAELFRARALSVRADLTIDERDHVAINRICQRLDGLPLAVELAAARVSTFSPVALESQLAEGLPLPAGPRDLPERQRTLRSTIGWSYQLLEPGERAMLRSLAAFLGGIRLSSVQQMWGFEAVDNVISLAEKSLLRRREDPDGEARFWMLETIRQFAADLATADGSARAAARAHAEHYYLLSEQASPHLIGPDQRLWLDRLEADHANLRVALEHLTMNSSAQALRMVATMTWFWEMRGYEPEARRRLTEALASAPADSNGRGEALFCAGWVAWSQGEPALARPLLLAAAPLLTHPEGARVLSQVYSHLGMVGEMLREQDDIMQWHTRAIAVARDAGDDWALGVALNNYAIVRPLRGDVQRSLSILEEALTLLRRTGDSFMIAMTAGNIAETALDAGELDRAETMLEEALGEGRKIDFRPAIAGDLVVSAAVTLERGDLAGTVRFLREALDIGSMFQMEAPAMLLMAAGALAASQRQAVEAATLWGAADALRGRIGLGEVGVTARLRARWQPQAQAAARTPEDWDAALQAGADLSLQDAIAVAADSIGSLALQLEG